MGKKGISAVIAMVMIILITIATVVILWAAIIPLINDQLRLAEDCRKATTSIRIIDACSTVENLTMSLTRSSEEFNLNDMQIAAGDPKETTARYYIQQLGFPGTSMPGPNEKRFYSWNITHDLNKRVSFLLVAPVVKYKNKVKTCDQVLRAEVPWCNSTLNQIIPKWGL